MKRFFLISIFLFLAVSSFSQQIISFITPQGNVVADTVSKRRTMTGLVDVEVMKGNVHYTDGWYNHYYTRYSSSRNDGVPNRILWLNNSGQLKISPIDSVMLPFSRITGVPNYLTSFTETDPLVPSWVKTITSVEKTNWNTSFGWGNHASAGYLTMESQILSIFGDTLELSPGNAVVLNYLKDNDTLSLSNRINAKFNIPTGTALQYLRGDGTIATFPAIPAAQVNADWSASSGISQILNKPTTLAGYNISDAYPLTGNPSGFLNATSANALYYPLSSNPAGYAKMIDTIGGSGNGTIMTTASATNSLNGKVGKTTTLTINGTTQDLSANRTWTITNITGNAGTATALQTARTINGQSFNGTANITIPGSAITSIPNSSLTNNSITINGNSVALGSSTTVTASPNIQPPVAGLTLTSGTAFQPRAGGPCNIVINSSLGSGLAAVTGTIVIATSATQNGTYTTVTTDGLILSLLNTSLDRSSTTIPIPTGYWVKVTTTVVGVGATISSTYTRWDL